MRRTLSVLTATLGLVVLGACSQVEEAAQQAVNKVECGATTKLAEKLPKGDDLDRTTITRGASLARQLDSVLGRIPGDRVPAAITDAIRTASTDLDSAAQTYDADPTAAKAKAAAAVAAVRTAVTDATTDLGC
ncbi:MAG: hypothetical protein RL531_1055 [Actinomycetota bacterium]|jgi:hypothetical protein